MFKVKSGFSKKHVDSIHVYGFSFQVELWGITDLYIPKHYLQTITSELGKHGFHYKILVADMER